MKHAWVHASVGLACELLLLQVLREPEPEPTMRCVVARILNWG